MKLSDHQIRSAKPAEKPYRLADGGGLVLHVQPSGARWWRVRYRVNGVHKMLSLGVYPDVTLKDARDRLTELRRQLAAGVDPSVTRRLQKSAETYTFAIVAKEWLTSQKEFMSEATYRKARWILEDLCGPRLGTRPIAQITSAEVLKLLEEVDKRGHGETARRIRQRVGAVMRYAIVREYAERDVTVVLRDALRPKRVEHHAAITEPERIGELLRAIHGYQGATVTAAALKLAPLLYVRPGELRAAQWSEVDLVRAEWRIPAPRMKMREAHIVPLPRQAVEIITELKKETGSGRFLFPSLFSGQRCMSENTVNLALRRMGYESTEMTAHGFRTMASTTLNEMGWDPELIEMQLAHRDRNKVRDAYNRAARMLERRKMMQAWADHLDDLRRGTREPAALRLVHG